MAKAMGIAVVLALGIGAASAAANERTAYPAIAAQDWASAERRLLSELRIHPGRPELLINLAAVYARTGREAQARELYLKVLDRPAVALDLPSGEVRSSHALADVALNRSRPALASAR